MLHGMKKKYSVSLFIFRRDLRIPDNSALIAACEQSQSVIPCFIVDPRQVSKKNKYRSLPAIQFMGESLQDLAEQFKKKGARLYLFKGVAHTVIQNIIKQLPIDAVFCNRDYTPFSIKRDEAIRAVCARADVDFIQHNDLLLTQPEEIKTKSGTPYLKFTPFFKTAKKQAIAKPYRSRHKNFYTKKIVKMLATGKQIESLISPKNKNRAVQGGRSEALKTLKKMKKFKNYAKERDFPALDATTRLSAHNKFGTISIREFYHAIAKQLGTQHLLIEQLYWRDFFTQVAYHSPFVFGQSFQQAFDRIKWSKSKKLLTAWCTGKTGFPIVDAGMRQLNETGFMHNRVRMIVASFLTKDLHIDWRTGEKYFAQHLVDYDPAVNNGNWQWCASTGCDAQPYFRIFNPWLQQKKFDPACEYIKQFVQELEKLSAAEIHARQSSDKEINGYPKPLIDHAKEREKAIKVYKKAKYG